MASFVWPIFQASITAPNLASLPATATDGALGVTTDTYSIYVFEQGTGWVLVTGSGAPISSVNTNSITTQIVANVISSALRLSANAADASNTIVALDIEGSGSLGLRAQILNSNITSLFSGTSPIQYSAGVVSILTASGSQAGALSAADWTTFNSKQPAGSYITALTGDVTATGPGSVAATLATVNSNVGSFGSATQVGGFTVNGKGLITAASNTSIQIAESQVTNLVSDLAGKQPVGNYITALTGDATASGPGSAALTLATVNGNVGSFGSSTSIPNFTVNAKGLITAAGGNAVVAPAGTLSGTALNSTVVSSSLASVGTIATGVWNGTAVDAAHGGTGQTSLTANNVILGNGTSPVQFVAPGTSGNVLTSNGSTWQSSPASGGGGYAGEVFVSAAVTSNSTLSASSSFAAFSTSPMLSFTPTYTGTYKLWCSASYYTLSGTMHTQIASTGVNTPTFLAQGDSFQDDSGTLRNQMYTWALIQTVAGTPYIFYLEAYCSTNMITIDNMEAANGNFMIAERIA